MQHKIIRNLLSKIECEDIAREFDNLRLTDQPIKGVEGNCEGIYNFEYVSMIQQYLTPFISKEFDKNLVPTYCYTRKYKKDSLLISHKDRPSCEYSLTLHIKSSDTNIPWPIYFEMDDKKQNFILNQGDCCLYKGMQLRHGRDICPVDWYIQVFMHWVDLNGEYSEYANDITVKKLLRINDNT
jgi:hypothetical protein